MIQGYLCWDLMKCGLGQVLVAQLDWELGGLSANGYPFVSSETVTEPLNQSSARFTLRVVLMGV